MFLGLEDGVPEPDEVPWAVPTHSCYMPAWYGHEEGGRKATENKVPVLMDNEEIRNLSAGKCCKEKIRQKDSNGDVECSLGDQWQTLIK